MKEALNLRVDMKIRLKTPSFPYARPRFYDSLNRFCGNGRSPLLAEESPDSSEESAG